LAATCGFSVIVANVAVVTLATVATVAATVLALSHSPFAGFQNARKTGCVGTDARVNEPPICVIVVFELVNVMYSSGEPVTAACGRRRANAVIPLGFVVVACAASVPFAVTVRLAVMPPAETGGSDCATGTWVGAEVAPVPGEFGTALPPPPHATVVNKTTIIPIIASRWSGIRAPTVRHLWQLIT
jgi:hypothetical protein